MTTVGIRELKSRLSFYVRRVRRGGVVRVTDRGEVVAELRQPAPEEEVPPELAGLAELAKRGIVRLGKSNKGVKYPLPPWSFPDGTAKELLDFVRGDRD